MSAMGFQIFFRLGWVGGVSSVQNFAKPLTLSF